MSANLKSQFVHRLSSVHLSVTQWALNLMHRFFQILLLLPLGNALRRFEFLTKNFFFDFLQTFFIFVNLWPFGSENFKTLLLVQIAGESFQNLDWDFEILSFWFLTFFFLKISNSPLNPMEKPKTLIIWKSSHRRAKRSKIWDLGVV